MIEFSDKQKEFMRSAAHRWNFKVGATRSGKTYMDYYLIPRRIRNRIGKDGLSFILGVTRGTIERNLLEPMRTIWGPAMVGEISSANTCYLFGERVYCLGAEKVSQVSKLRGSSVKYCYGDEVADWSPDVFELLKSRLDKSYSCFDGALNPQGPNHWLKQFLESDADIYAQHYTLFDNPFLPVEVRDAICEEYKGTVYYKRYVLGEWALAEGLIYPMYEEALEDPPSGPADTYMLSMDYGTQNAFAAILWGRYGGTWYALAEYYYSGRDTGIQKTDEEYARDIDAWLADYFADVVPETIKTIIDPSAASFITLLRKREKYKVIPAINDVADGIRETATAMRTGVIKISPSLKNWQMEAGGYVWDEGAIDDRPVKVNDHLMDAMRYFVKTNHITIRRATYRPLWNTEV